MNTALYRKYRSRTLDEIVGQRHITSLLQAAIARDKISHAYLLTGPRGVGKTSIARIIAHEINQLPYDDDSQHLDIIEIDAASHNGVEDVRELREKVHIAPSSAAKKVYIIDEVHMLSKPAFNALLKTLEEPPEHVVFIMATTDIDKLPATIISRVQRFNFRTISVADISAHLRTIADKESIPIDDDALELIARSGGGSFRDSISLLDQLQHLGGSDQPISLADVEQSLGLVNVDVIDQLLAALRSGNVSDLAGHIEQLETVGAQASVVADQLIAAVKADITKHPDELALLDNLLDVGRSSHPYIKLLSVLAQFNEQPQKTVTEQPNRAVSNKTPATAKPEPGTANPPSPEPAPKPTSTERPKAPPKPIVAPTSEQSDLGDFDWNKFLSSTNGDVALRSLIAKCEHVVVGKEITIYATSKFNAGRLKSAKQLPKMHAALEKAGYGDYSITISESSKPPADSQLANVAAIMGGGTEVELNDGN